MSQAQDRTLTGLLDRLEHAGKGDCVSFDDVLDEFGDRAITPFILLISLVMISPISGIPGAPTISAMIIVLLAVQALSGRRRLWLPPFLLHREIAADRLTKALGWMRKPSAFVDRHTHPRLKFLSTGPLRAVALLACALIPLGWPFLEVLPFVSTFGALTVGLLVFGLFTRDGLYVLAGYALIAATLTAGFFLFVQ
ncbi:MAG: exopolysaccharide biosynthesis protein [Sulfitobacter sp.]